MARRKRRTGRRRRKSGGANAIFKTRLKRRL